MMIIMQFAFQIILLAVGFGVGYWLIIAANTQQGTLKTFGQALGGALIIMAVVLEIFSAYYSMKLSNRGYMQGGCPMNKTMNPMMNQDKEINDRSQIEQDTNTQRINPQECDEEYFQKNQGKPIKSNKDDRD